MLFSLLKTARLLRLFRAARKLDRNYEYMTSLLFLMIMFFMLVAHWLACIWYAIGAKEAVEYDSLSWLSVLGYQMDLPITEGDSTSGPTLRTRYLTSLYYVMTLCTTVGFGNVSANTDGERIFSICCMLMGGRLLCLYFIARSPNLLATVFKMITRQGAENIQEAKLTNILSSSF